MCKKVFKNEKQMDNHLQSKKHKENFARLKGSVELDGETEQMIQEEERRRAEAAEIERERIREEKLREIEA